MTKLHRAALAALALSIAGAGVAGPSAPAHAQAAKPKPKPKPKQVFPYWENYLRIPAAERTRFQVAYVLSVGGKSGAGLPLFAVDGNRRVPIVVGPDGRMRPPPLEFFKSKNAYIDAPTAKGRNFSVNLELLATTPPARELDAGQMSAALAQSNAGIRKAAGLIGVVAPKMGRVVLAGAESGLVVDAQGRQTPLPRVAGESGPYFQPAAMPSARRIVLARTPSKIKLAPAPKRGG